MSAAAVAVFIAWIGAIVNTPYLPIKTWLVVELVLGLLGLRSSPFGLRDRQAGPGWAGSPGWARSGGLG
jgi:hypothetical protein